MNINEGKKFESPKKIEIVAIDPGPETSGIVVLGLPSIDIFARVSDNRDVKCFLKEFATKKHDSSESIMVYEMYANYGMPSGDSAFRTCIQIGHFCALSSIPYDELCRMDVKLTICKSHSANDSTVRQSSIDMFGGKEKAIGGVKCKKCKGKKWFGRDHTQCQNCKGTGWSFPPGPLYSVKGDAWSALAVSLTYAIQKGYLSPLVANPGGLCKNFQPSNPDVFQDIQKEYPTRPDEPS